MQLFVVYTVEHVLAECSCLWVYTVGHVCAECTCLWMYTVEHVCAECSCLWCTQLSMYLLSAVVCGVHS